MSLKPFKIKKEELINTANPHLTVANALLETPYGDETTWSYIKSHDAVTIFALDSHENVFLKKEWRIGRKDFVWELPSGFIEELNPTAEQIQNAANRELREEIGVKGNKLEKLGEFSVFNYMTMKSHIFIARDLETSPLKPDEHEYLETQKLPIEEAYKLVTETQVPTASTMVAFGLFFIHKASQTSVF